MAILLRSFVSLLGLLAGSGVIAASLSQAPGGPAPPAGAADVQVGAMRFRVHTIDSTLRSGYQVVAVDLTRDGRKDLIALTEGLPELVWFESPAWQRHVMVGGLRNMVSIAAQDLDGDAIPEVALGHEFSGRPGQRPGVVAILRHNADVRQPWTVTEIDRVPTTHRLRWFDPEGTGQFVLLNGPMANPESLPVAGANPVPVYLYRPGTWERETITDTPRGYLHGLTVVDWFGRGPRDLLTASSDGIHVWQRQPEGAWRGTLLARGNDEPFPRAGTADVRVGRTENARFLAAIEPYHGNIVAVYVERDGAWQRQVIEDGLATGHAIAVADVDANGRDDIVVGFRGEGHRLYLFTADDATAARWTRHVLDDGGMAAAACIAEDILGDGRPDVACMGSGTNNLKVYEPY